MMGLHWAFVVAAIFGVFALAVPITLAQQQSTTVDDQGPIIGMVMSLSIRVVGLVLVHSAHDKPVVSLYLFRH
jgi:uncharacterized membrane protein